MLCLAERLGLPLDGSESGKETVTEEDDFGNFTRMIVEGVDLTDPGNSTVASTVSNKFYQNFDFLKIFSPNYFFRNLDSLFPCFSIMNSLFVSSI